MYSYEHSLQDLCIINNKYIILQKQTNNNKALYCLCMYTFFPFIYGKFVWFYNHLYICRNCIYIYFNNNSKCLINIYVYTYIYIYTFVIKHGINSYIIAAY